MPLLSLDQALAQAKTVDPSIYKMAEGIVLREGGYVNTPYDAGGATKYGISLLFARSEYYIDAKGRPQLTFDMNQDGKVDYLDIEEITPEIATAVFVVDFYLKPGIGSLPLCLQPAVFDTSVNGGQFKAITLVQDTINDLRATVLGVRSLVPMELVDDGILGGKTNVACHLIFDLIGSAKMVDTFCDERCADYKAIAQTDPRDEEFLNGWLIRANSFRVKES